MIYVSDHGKRVEICSPEEVVLFRENRNSQEPFNSSQEIPHNIAKKIAQIHKVHGYANETNCLYLLSKVDYELVFCYDFSSGYKYTFSPMQFPSYIQNDKETILNSINYALMILEALGWIVTFSEDDLYHFNFAPLIALTPEEVAAKIDQRINTIAANALQVINHGLVNHKHKYFRKEVDLTPAQISAEDADLVINRLRELLGNKWFIKGWDGCTFEVIPNPTEGW